MKYIRKMINLYVEQEGKNKLQDEEYFLDNNSQCFTEDSLPIALDIIKNKQKIKLLDDDATPEQIVDYLVALDIYFGEAIEWLIYNSYCDLQANVENLKGDDFDEDRIYLIVFRKLYTLLSYIQIPNESYVILKKTLDRHDYHPDFRPILPR